MAIGALYRLCIYHNCSTCVGDLINVSPSDPDLIFNWWVESLWLFDNDKNVMREGKELTCNIINAAGSLLKQQFPNVLGF